MFDTPEDKAATRKVVRKRQLDITFLEIARSLAKLSHCQSYKVGAVLVKDGRVLSTGYNGSPPGHVNCDDLFPDRADSSFDREKHHQWSNLHEIHAEQNLVAFSARHGVSIEGGTLYSSLQPCMHCTKLLIAAGVKRIVYDEVYDMSDESQTEFLKTSGIEVERISLISERGEI